VIDDLGHPVVVALTATAAERLGLRDPVVVVRGFDRPNIRLAAERAATATDKDDALLERATEHARHGSGILYVGTRRRAEELAAALLRLGVPAAPCHAGLPCRRRDATHYGFLARDPAVVAATAFGMGIDKPDVLFVLHGDIPDSVDAYYQEFGRAGREGDPAAAVLYHGPEDLALRRHLGRRRPHRSSRGPCRVRRSGSRRRPGHTGRAPRGPRAIGSQPSLTSIATRWCGRYGPPRTAARRSRRPAGS